MLLALLIALAIGGVALLAGLDWYSVTKQRERESDLIWVGEQYRSAIERYYRAGRQLPASLDELVNDARFTTPMHHLRRLYPDPMTGNADWELVTFDGRILGVHSRSSAAPIKLANFPRRYADFKDAKTYADWVFVYLIPVNNPLYSAPAVPTSAPRIIPGSQPQSLPKGKV